MKDWIRVDAGPVLCVVCVFFVGREMRHSLRTDLTCTTGNTAQCCSAAFSADRYTLTQSFLIGWTTLTVQSVLM